MMTELSVILQPEYVWLNLAAFAAFAVYALWAIIAGVRVTRKQERFATVTRRAA